MRLGRIVATSASAAAIIVAGSAPSARAAPASRHIYDYVYASRCPAAGIAESVDRWGMYVCNCTSYVAWALAANGQRTDWFIPGAMDARNWPHVAILAGLQVGRLPQVGAVAVWPHLFPPFGHVGYVTAVDRDDRFDVSEYNFPPAAGLLPFLFDRRKDVSSHGVFFVYVPTRAY